MNYQEHPRTRELGFGPSSKANSFITKIKTSPRWRFQINDSGASPSLFFSAPIYRSMFAYFILLKYGFMGRYCSVKRQMLDHGSWALYIFIYLWIFLFIFGIGYQFCLFIEYLTVWLEGRMKLATDFIHMCTL